MINCLQVQKEEEKSSSNNQFYAGTKEEEEESLRMKLIVKKSQVSVCIVNQFPHHEVHGQPKPLVCKVCGQLETTWCDG
jgi:hypothetical protein